MQTPALALQGQFGFQLQASEGTQANGSACTWLPLAAPLGFGPVLNVQPFDQGDSYDFERHAYSTGQWYAGDVKFPLCPSMLQQLLLGTSNWLMARDANGQGKFATCFWKDKPSTGNVWRAAQDVKILQATFEFVRRGPVMVTLSLVGKGPAPVVVPGETLFPRAAPFLWVDCSTDYWPWAPTDEGDGGLDEENLKGVTIQVLTGLQSPGEGARCRRSYNPAKLYNVSGVSVRGVLVRDYQNTNVELASYYSSDAGSDGDGSELVDDTYDGALTITLRRGLAQLTVLVPRMRYQNWRNPLLGSRRGIQEETADWVGLSKRDPGPPRVWLPPIGFMI